MKKKILSWVGYSVFIVLIVTASLELASQIYIHNYRRDLLRQSYQQENPTEFKRIKDWHGNFKRSPFFGYVTKYGNNYGFSSSEDYPLAKDDNTFVIAVLGGSVADYFVRHIVANERLTDRLKEHVPALKNKYIRFMNLAIPGYKQPQQFIALSYFVEHIDMVIQLDGWNEVWSRTSGAYPMDYPTFSEFLYDDESNGRISDVFEKKERAEAIRMHPILGKSAIMILYRNILLKNVYSESQDLSNPKASFYNRMNSAEDIQQILVGNWKKYTTMEQTILKLHNKPGFFFIQPSQYNPESKTLSSEEQSTVINNIFSNSVADFLALRKEASKLGVYDLAMVFKPIKETVYIDDCCHINDKGNEIIADAIFRTIGQNYKLK
nr:SGNH/GDSL hydrolase family protein [Bacteriovorax sp. HI3]